MYNPIGTTCNETDRLQRERDRLQRVRDRLRKQIGRLKDALGRRTSRGIPAGRGPLPRTGDRAAADGAAAGWVRTTGGMGSGQRPRRVDESHRARTSGCLNGGGAVAVERVATQY